MMNNCSSWIKVDLHIHSKYSYESRAKMEIDTIFKKAISENIKLISITDHNNVDGLDEMIELADMHKQDITFLPGIEFRTDNGDKSVHAIAVFPPKIEKDGFISVVNKEFITQNIMAQLGLTRVEITSAGGGDYVQGLFHKTVDFENMSQLVRKWGGIIIVHATKTNGIEGGMTHCQSSEPSEDELLSSLGTKKQELMTKYIDVCELRNWNNGELKQQKFYLKQFSKPSVVFSDAHSVEEIGKQYTWVKMDNPSFEGLIQIKYEPKLRITIAEESPKAKYKYLHSVSSSGGYFKGLTFKFCPELNIFIGPRGSGKSVVVDLIKFVFGKYSPDDKETQSFLQRLYELLRYDNTVSVEYYNEDGELNKYSRTLKLTNNEKNKLLVDSSEAVSSDISDNFEVFGQGELKSLLKRAEAKIKLLDDLGETFDEKEQITIYTSYLMENGKLQLELSQEINPLIEKFSKKHGLKKLEEEIQLKLSGFDLQEYILRENRNKYYELYLKKYDVLLQLINEFKEKITNNLDIETNDDILTNLFYEKFAIIKSIISSRISAIDEEIINQKELFLHVNTEFGVWKDYYEKEHTGFLQYLKENNIENVIDETKKLRSIQAEILEIESNDEKTLVKKASELHILQQNRLELLSQLYQTQKTLRQKRIQRCEQLNDVAPEKTIKLLIDNEPSKSVLSDFLHKILTGKSIRNLDEQIKGICEYSEDISDLVELIYKKNLKELSDACQITSNTASVLLSELIDDSGVSNYGSISPINSQLFELELLSFEDIIHIQAFDAYVGKYKDIRRFSQGQQCSFLLSLIMASNRNTLVIDQPEDDLDWNYIKDFIEKLINLKVNAEGSGRQFIFATHNQNVTVLADSEKIYYLNNKPTENDADIPSGVVKACGGLERTEVKDAVLSLEGGVDAFKLRLRKYGII